MIIINNKTYLPVLSILMLFSQSTICLGNDYHHLRGAGSDNHVQDSHDLEDAADLHKVERQRVLLIAGPHKTGSTSIQNNMYQWMTSNNKNNNRHPHFKNWSWSGPEEVFENSNRQEHMHGKIFYPFGEALHGCGFGRRIELQSEYSCDKLLKLYRDTFKKHWNQGYNLVIGTEAFDWIGADIEPIAINHLLAQMPWNNAANYRGQSVVNGRNDDVTVVVKYRSPRVKHLISWWHQCCMKEMTFYQFVLKEMKDYDDRGSRIIDSLQLVERLLEAGLNVVLIDLSGVIDKGYDLSNVIACDVMKVPCTEDKNILGETEAPVVKNTKRGGNMGAITSDHMEKMEKVIRRRDCAFKHLEGHDKLQILYPKDLAEVYQSCLEDEGITRKEMNNQILDIVKID